MFGKKKDKKGDAHGAEAEKPAAEAEGAEGAEGGGKKKLPKKILIMAAAGLLVLVGGGGGAAYFLLLKPKAGAETAEAGHGEAAAAEGGHGEASGGHGGGEGGAEVVDAAGGTVRPGPAGVTFYTLPDVLTNIQTTDGRPNALKLKITFELANGADATVIGEQMPRLQDLLQTFLRELRPEDLNGSQGMFRLRQEIQRRVNLVLTPSKVNAVLIEEMLQT